MLRRNGVPEEMSKCFYVIFALPSCKTVSTTRKPNIHSFRRSLIRWHRFASVVRIWESRIVYIDRQTGKQKEKSKGGFKTKKERVRATWTRKCEVTADTYLHVTKKMEDDALALYEQ